MKREVVYSPLDLKDGQYQIDFERFRKDIQGCKVLILCNPHNPGGRVWTCLLYTSFGTEGDGFLIVFHGRLLHVMLQAFVTHKDVFAGILHEGFLFLQCCLLQCTVFLFQTVDDVQLPADEALHVGLLDVVAGMDGFEKLIQESAEVPFVEGFGGGNVLNAVSYTHLNQNVKAGETVFTIQPSDSSRVLGKALLPLQGSGKVHVGQRVHIRLNNYPDQEFGYVKGQVASISPAPTEEGMYIVEITLPDGMQTNYGKQLPVSRELKGTADIILADKNVLERLLAPLRKVVEYEK